MGLYQHLIHILQLHYYMSNTCKTNLAFKLQKAMKQHKTLSLFPSNTAVKKRTCFGLTALAIQLEAHSILCFIQFIS